MSKENGLDFFKCYAMDNSCIDCEYKDSCNVFAYIQQQINSKPQAPKKSKPIIVPYAKIPTQEESDNSSSKKDCYNVRCKRGYNFNNKCHWKFMNKCEERKRSPS